MELKVPSKTKRLGKTTHYPSYYYRGKSKYKFKKNQLGRERVIYDPFVVMGSFKNLDETGKKLAFVS